MEHLHHQRRSLVLLLIVVAASCGAACGSHGDVTGTGVPLPEPARNVGGAPIGGADLGGANDPGSGIVPESTPAVCTSNADCAGGLCNGDSTRPGACLRVCALPPAFAEPDLSIVRCRADEECIALAVTSKSVSDIGLCLRPCKTDRDCPDLGSKVVRNKCDTFQPGQFFCVAEQLTTGD